MEDLFNRIVCWSPRSKPANNNHNDKVSSASPPQLEQQQQQLPPPTQDNTPESSVASDHSNPTSPTPTTTNVADATATTIASPAKPNNISQHAELFNAKPKVEQLVDGLLSPRAHTSKLFEAIGDTPLLKLESLCALTGCTILGKAEFMNPGGSAKDRPAKYMILDAEKNGQLIPHAGYTVIEASGGNTGVTLSMLASCRGYKCIITVPESVGPDKVNSMKLFGAEVIRCPVVPFSDERHFYHTASRLAQTTPKCFWTNQFENMANFRSHYESTGPEIWSQSNGKLDAFVASCGTGGTLAGISSYIKEHEEKVKVYMIDPPGSALYSYMKQGKCEMHGATKVYEGIGINRITKNFAAAKIDEALTGEDQDGIDVCYYLLQEEGLFVGPSAALNLYGCLIAAKQLGPGHTICTVLCDTGYKYSHTIYDQAFLEKNGIKPNPARIAQMFK